MTASSDALSYGELHRELHQKAAECRQPLNGVFELTTRCNLACRMCFVRELAHERNKRRAELKAHQWLSLGKEAVDAGTLFLLLTGGEVFLRPDFFDIYWPLARLGLVVTIFSNATLITADIAAKLASSPPASIELTLYGATETTYECVTGVRGSYRRCLAGIERLLKHDLRVAVRTTLTRDNVAELDAMNRLAATEWGLTLGAGWLLTPRRDGSSSEIAMQRLSVAECVELEMASFETREGNAEFVHDRFSDGSRLFQCYAGRAGFAITGAGDMNACLELPLPAAQPLEIGFNQAWREVNAFVESAPPLAPSCVDCEAKPLCSLCPAWSMAEASSLQKPVPHLCALAFARAARFEVGEDLRDKD
jgi:radical SAM protein with 4Fe4S-binding SPASM domain